MISEFLYVIKMGILTVVVVFLMQIQVNNKSIESHTYSYITSTSTTLKLNQVAKGILNAANEGYKLVNAKIKELTHSQSSQPSNSMIPAAR